MTWLASHDELLKESWLRYAEADHTASRLKRRSRRVLATALVLTFLTVLVAALRTMAGASGPDPLLLALTISPILVALVMLYLERLGDGGGWIQTRHAAEAVLGAIYRFRTSHDVRGADDDGGSPRNQLAKRVALPILSAGSPRSLIRLQLLCEIDPLFPPDLPGIHPHDRLLDPLGSDEYDEVRAKQQLDFHRREAAKGKSLATRHLLYLGGAAGAAAVGLSGVWGEQSWAPVLLALATATTVAVVSWREYEQRDRRAISFRFTATAIGTARARWQSADADDRRAQDATSRFAQEVEEALSAQNEEWRQFSEQADESVRAR